MGSELPQTDANEKVVENEVDQNDVSLKIIDEEPVLDMAELREQMIALKIKEIDESAEAAKTKCKKPVKLTWEDVTYSVMLKDPASKSKFRPERMKADIIKSVSGYALPGQTLYVMGASGAGKTSLLNLISDRASEKNGARIQGKILINNKDRVSQNTFGTIASFVMQDDILFEFLTVREALTFAARLRLHYLPVEE